MDIITLHSHLQVIICTTDIIYTIQVALYDFIFARKNIPFPLVSHTTLVGMTLILVSFFLIISHTTLVGMTLISHTTLVGMTLILVSFFILILFLISHTTLVGMTLILVS